MGTAIGATSRSQSQDQLLDLRDSRPRFHAFGQPSLDSTKGAGQSPFSAGLTSAQMSTRILRDTDSEAETGSLSSYHLHGSFDLLDEDPLPSFPVYPEPAAQPPPDDQFTQFPPPPSLPSTSSPRVMFHPSVPPSPRRDDDDDTKPGSSQIVERF